MGRLIVNREQLAELMGVHPDTIHEWQRAGMPVIARGRRGRASKFNGPACVAWWNERRGRLTPLEAAQVRRLTAGAQLTELAIDRMAAGLVKAEEADAAFDSYCLAWQAMVRRLHTRAVAALPGRVDAAGLQQLCEALVADIEKTRRKGLQAGAQ